MTVGPAVDTIVTSIKPSRSPANNPAKIRLLFVLFFGTRSFMLLTILSIVYKLVRD